MGAQSALIYVITAMLIAREEVAIATGALVRLLNVVALVVTLDEIATRVRVGLPQQLLKEFTDVESTLGSLADLVSLVVHAAALVDIRASEAIFLKPVAFFTLALEVARRVAAVFAALAVHELGANVAVLRKKSRARVETVALVDVVAVVLVRVEHVARIAATLVSIYQVVAVLFATCRKK